MKWPPWRGSWDFFHLLLAAQPSTFDIALLITGTIGAILAGLPFPLVGLLYGKLLDDLNQGCGDADPETLSRAIGQKVVLVGAIGILNFLLIYTYMGAWTLFGERLTHRIKCTYFEALLRQEMAFFDTQPSGEAAARLEADIQAVQSGTSEKVGIYITSLSYFVTAYVVAFTQDAKLTMMLSALIPIYFLSSTLGNHFTVKFTTAVNDGVSKATNIASECLSNITIIHAFGAAKQFEASFAGHLARIAPQATGKFVTAACQLGFLYLIAYTSNALAIWQGSIHIADSVHSQDKDFSFGKVYSVILLLLDASFVFTSISPFLTIFSTATVSYEKLAKVISRDSAIDWSKSSNRMIPDQFEGELELRNVTFNYPSRPETAVMTDLTLQMPAHKMTAIVGASGSGKSTVVGLLTRLYDPTQGAVLLDDINIKTMDASTLRRSIAVVSQDPDLFDRSILENVVFGRAASFGGLADGAFEQLAEKVRGGLKIEDAAMGITGMSQVLKLVEKALKQAGAWDFVSNFENGMATSVGPKGRRLSGGQRQRVALARAFFRRASVIVLDEATASLDSANESLVQDTIARELQGSTIVLITHRISSTKRADKVVVMRQGEITETGSYDELINAGGEFANMSRLQSFEREKQAKSAFAKKSEEASASDGHDRDSLDELRLSTEDPLNEDEEAGLLDKSEKEPGAAKSATTTWNVFKKIISLARRQRRWIIAGAGFAIFVGLSHSIEAVLMGNTVEAVSVCQKETNIRYNGAKYGILFAVIGAAEFGANVMSSTSFGRVSESLLYKTRVLSLSALLDQSVEWHESEGRTPASLLSIISTDAASLSGITGNVLGISFGVIVSLAAGVLISFIIAWRIAILLVATVPILLGSGFMRLTVLAKFQEKHAAAFTRSVGVAKEAIDNISTVAAYGLETESLAAYKRALREPYNATLRTVAYGNFWLALSYSIGNVIYALAYWWGAKNILEGYYTQAQFFTVLPALLVGAQGAGQLFSMVPDITRAGMASRRVLDLIQLAPRPIADLDNHKATPSETTKAGGYNKVPLDEDPESGIELSEDLDARFTEAKRLLTDLDDTSSPTLLSSGRPLAVSLRDIHFSYPSRPESQVLKGLSLDIPAGSFAALVGPSGSGKSTVLALIERFFTPSSGSVQVGDFGSQSLRALRDAVALVPQSAMLFDETIAFNLSLGAPPNGPPPTAQDLETVCRQVALHDTIAALPEGYDTKLGPNGSRLSGGQRQRLAIARALLRRPRLLLLDEPTSALDPESERVCEQTLNEIRERGGVTVVVIAHRLHTVRNADCIYLVEGGQCTERGTHEELMVRSAHYRESVKSQTMDV